jgi:hypothetical protein
VVQQSPAARIVAIAREMTRIRQRGFDRLEFADRKQDRVSTSALEGVAAELGFEGDDRAEVLASMLQEQLNALAESGRRYEADLVRRLLFDDPASAPSTPQARLDGARLQARLTDGQFGNRQAAVFRDFATFLVAAVTPPEVSSLPANDDVDEPVGVEEAWWRRRARLAVAIGAAVLALSALVVWAMRGNRPESPTGASESVSASSSQSTTPMLKFNNYGSTLSNVISVYPGVTESPADEIPNGSFLNGDVVPAVCKLTGRTIPTDPHYGETPRTESTWIEVRGSPGTRQFASLTYATVSDTDLARLPICS